MHSADSSKEREGEQSDTAVEAKASRSRSSSHDKATKSPSLLSKLPSFFKSDVRQALGWALSNKGKSPKSLSTYVHFSMPSFSLGRVI